MKGLKKDIDSRDEQVSRGVLNLRNFKDEYTDAETEEALLAEQLAQ